jgi:hypothetical protein
MSSPLTDKPKLEQMQNGDFYLSEQACHPDFSNECNENCLRNSSTQMIPHNSQKFAKGATKVALKRYALNLK